MKSRTLQPKSLIVVDGAFATGKTWLSSEISKNLQIPLISKDDIKETLFGTLGTGDLDWSKKLGAASFEVLWALCERTLSTSSAVMIETVFDVEHSVPRIKAIADKLGAQIVLIHLHSDHRIRIERAIARVNSGKRHPGHCDDQYEEADIPEARSHLPIDTRKVIKIDTTDFSFVDPIKIAKQISNALVQQNIPTTVGPAAEEFSLVEKIPTPNDYNTLRETVGWGSIPSDAVNSSLGNSRYSICAFHRNRVIVQAWMLGKGIDDKIDEAFSEFADSPRLIVDLRASPGGNLLMAHRFRNRFLLEDGPVGWIQTTMPDGTLAEKESILGKISPDQRRWTKPVVFLTDSLTYSASEDALLGLQGQKNVRIVGQRSGGGSGRMRLIRLLPGYRLTISTALTFDQRGNCIEGAGIPVDHELPLSIGEKEDQTLKHAENIEVPT
jgi:predicted kinase